MIPEPYIGDPSIEKITPQKMAELDELLVKKARAGEIFDNRGYIYIYTCERCGAAIPAVAIHVGSTRFWLPCITQAPPCPGVATAQATPIHHLGFFGPASPHTEFYRPLTPRECEDYRAAARRKAGQALEALPGYFGEITEDLIATITSQFAAHLLRGGLLARKREEE